MATKTEIVSQYTALALMLERDDMKGLTATIYETLADAKGINPKEARDIVLGYIKSE